MTGIERHVSNTLVSAPPNKAVHRCVCVCVPTHTCTRLVPGTVVGDADDAALGVFAVLADAKRSEGCVSGVRGWIVVPGCFGRRFLSTGT